MAQSVEHATVLRTVLGSRLGHFLLFGQKQGFMSVVNRSGKIEHCVIPLASASVNSKQGGNEQYSTNSANQQFHIQSIEHIYI